MDSITEQILVHLYNCIDYGFSYRVKRGLYILDEFSHYGKNINAEQIKKSIRDLSKAKLIKKKKDFNGSIIISLNEKGILRALNLDFKKLYNKKEKWDGKWRMVAFDIPEESRKGRDALRYRLRLGGFYELQESLFLYPYDCKKEVMAFVKLFKIDRYVRFGVLESIDNQEHINKIFGLN